MFDWMMQPLRKYADVSGRARRREYWLFILFLFLASIVTQTLDTMLGLGTFEYTNYHLGWSGWTEIVTTGGWISHIFHLAMIIPSITVAIRRLHDGDHSGWLLLWLLLPFIGWIILLVLYCLRGTPGPNRFGPDPITE